MLPAARTGARPGGLVGSPLTLSTAGPADDLPVLLPRRPAPRPGAIPPPRPRGSGGPGPSPLTTGSVPAPLTTDGLPVGARGVGSSTPDGVGRAGSSSPTGSRPLGAGVPAARTPAAGGPVPSPALSAAPSPSPPLPLPGPAGRAATGGPAPLEGPTAQSLAAAPLTRGPVVPGSSLARPGRASLPTAPAPPPLFTERRAPRPDPAVQAIELLVAELAATRGMLGELLAGHRSETVLLREEVARLREEVHARPVHPLLGVTRAVLQAHNDDLAQRALRLGGAASAAFVATAQHVGLDDDGLLALQEWVGGGGRGVVVATDERQRLLLGVAVLHHVVEQGRPVVVVAPRRQDVLEWSTTLRELLPSTPVITGRHRAVDGSDPGRVLVTTARAYARDEDREGPAAGLLVAVDAERFGAPSLATALDARVDWRLGLSGGYRRNDDGLVRLTDPYFDGGVVHVG